MCPQITKQKPKNPKNRFATLFGLEKFHISHTLRVDSGHNLKKKPTLCVFQTKRFAREEYFAELLQNGEIVLHKSSYATPLFRFKKDRIEMVFEYSAVVSMRNGCTETDIQRCHATIKEKTLHVGCNCK